jgi:hypothetical protein
MHTTRFGGGCMNTTREASAYYTTDTHAQRDLSNGGARKYTHTPHHTLAQPTFLHVYLT